MFDNLTGAGKATLALFALATLGGITWFAINQTKGGDAPADEKTASTDAPKEAKEGGGFFSGIFGGDEASSGEKTASAGSGAPLFSKENPAEVNLNSWIGWGGLLVANGGLTTTADSINGKSGIYVNYTINDELPTLSSLFEGGSADCGFRTVDWFAQEQPALRKDKHDARVIYLADNSRGSDALIARPGTASSIEDLAGKRVGATNLSVSHMLFMRAIEESSLSGRKRQSVLDGMMLGATPTEVREAYEQGKIDAAFLWEPDVSLAKKAVPGSAVVYSTATVTNFVYDAIVCDARALDNQANTANFKQYVANLSEGTKAAEADLTRTAEILIRSMKGVQAVADSNGGAPFIVSLFNGVQLMGLSENIRVFGLAGGTDFYTRVYKDADEFWRTNTDVIPADAPKINPSETADLRFIKELSATDATAKVEAAKPEFTFTATERAAVVKAEPVITKPVSINFTTGSTELTAKARKTLDSEVAPFIEKVGSAYISVEGNTDSTGSAKVNTRISEARAQAVVDYLVEQWEIPAERFNVRGNGPSKPACDEQNPEENLSLEDCQAMNRRTDIAVLSR